MLAKLSVQGRPSYLDDVGQWSIALVLGADGVV